MNINKFNEMNNIEKWSKKTGIKIGSHVRFSIGVWDENDNPKERNPKKKTVTGIVRDLVESEFGGIVVLYNADPGQKYTGPGLYNTQSKDVKMELL